MNINQLGQVYLISGKTDMRQGIDSLASLVREKHQLDPFSQKLFLFCGTKKDRFKILYWDGQGFWLFYKLFENGRLTWPSHNDDLIKLNETQVNWLLQGFSVEPKIKVANQRTFY
ncbi:IS66 family insertion sequence element accessory protein TnpB [Globicatella sanguinis]|uniref:IS66 family insertion sequence element accessory protein TnpB n=1 Tax=Globicatella sanguinis TaxID=13076 RepID=UPI0025439EF7|nr:IS66 family insertion sequence element accessory protein TnpB [Globicatella sanguinis]WIK67607.1 IS66 family insertion sequence element accessory protein TnpB [Globicatella sanguinis]WKT57012.1 IS66 family insertion sequence element accessory protein TnpB [Globicatella sanguinis]